MHTVVGDLTRFGQLVSRIYDGAINPAAWQAILQEVAVWLQTEKAFLTTPLSNKQEGIFITHGFREGEIELYHAFQAEDPWVQAALEKGYFREGMVALGTDLVTEDALKATRIYQEFLRDAGFTQILAGVVFDGQTPSTMTTTMALFRSDRLTRYEPADRERLKLIIPHISRALGVMFRLQASDLRTAASLAALDCLSAGVLLIAASGEVAFANVAAQHMLQEADGLTLKSLHGRAASRLLATDSKDQQEIEHVITQCIRCDSLDTPHFGKSLSIKRPSGRAPFLLQFSALPECNEFGTEGATPRAIVFLNDPSGVSDPNPDRLIELYGLTMAEARLAIALIDGDDLRTIALRLNISPNTAKTQLQSIYAKLEVDNRAKLTKALLALSGMHR